MKFYHTCDRDIVNEGFRFDMVLAFMAGNKRKDNDKMFSYTHMLKIHDAILFGARTVMKVLLSNYYTEMDSFLLSFKKENADAHSKGNVDKKSADPITNSLFQTIHTWAVEQKNIFVCWVWTILQ